MFHYRDLILRLRRAESQRDIQAALHVGPAKIVQVRKLATELGWLDSAADIPSDEAILAAVAATQKPPARMPSLVEPHRERVAGWVRSGMEAKTIWEALKRDHGFKGSYSSVQRFVKGLTEATPDPVVRLQFSAGECAQVDFGSGPEMPDPITGKPRKTHVFVMTLAYSRHQYAEVVWDQTVRTWLRCHRNAFEFWGGVPAKVTTDSLKAAIIRACRYDPQVQRSYGEFAEGYGFQISPCVIETPEHKGRVESGVRYVKRSFLRSPRTFPSMVNINEQLIGWVLGEAGNRIHGTTQLSPLAVFCDEEKPALKPLPAERVEMAVWSTVKIHPDCHAIFLKSYYSAPHRYIGKQLDLRAGDDTVTLFDQLDAVACHARATRPGQWLTNLDHLPPEKTAYLRQTPVWCLEQAIRIGPSCQLFLKELLGDRVVDRLRAAQGVLRMAKKYGRGRLEDACARALAYDNVRYRTVKRILEQGLDQIPLDETEGGQLELGFMATDAPRFARSIGELFPN